MATVPMSNHPALTSSSIHGSKVLTLMTRRRAVTLLCSLAILGIVAWCWFRAETVAMAYRCRSLWYSAAPPDTLIGHSPATASTVPDGVQLQEVGLLIPCTPEGVNVRLQNDWLVFECANLSIAASQPVAVACCGATADNALVQVLDSRASLDASSNAIDLIAGAMATHPALIADSMACMHSQEDAPNVNLVMASIVAVPPTWWAALLDNRRAVQVRCALATQRASKYFDLERCVILRRNALTGILCLHNGRDGHRVSLEVWNADRCWYQQFEFVSAVGSDYALESALMLFAGSHSLDGAVIEGDEWRRAARAVVRLQGHNAASD